MGSDAIPSPPAGAWEPRAQSRRQRSPRGRRRLCDLGCPCCPPQGRGANAFAAELQAVAALSAEVDGSRAVPYVDSHCHLEVMLQYLRQRECVPSLRRPFENMTQGERRLWRLLGWGRKQWGAPPVDPNRTWRIPWTELPPAKLAAAKALGWDRERWDGWWWLLPKDKGWEQLSDVERCNLVVLGESADSWDDMFASTRVGAGLEGDLRMWDALTMDEQKAAMGLGFTQPVWDMQECSDVHAFVQHFCGSGFDACITQGCDTDSMGDALRLASGHPKIFASFGCHPKSAWLYDQAHEEELLACFEKCGKKAVAWGEFGLDYSQNHWGDLAWYRQRQQEVFARQIPFALERNLPLVLHLRDASDDSLRIIRREVPRHWKAHVHSFLGSIDFIRALMAEFPNFYYGLTGTVTMGGDGENMGRIVPLDRMLLETDGPYMTPRGTAFNHVGQIPLIARKVAELKGLPVEEVCTAARANTRFVYGI